MVETADKITDDSGSLQQYLLLVGGLRALSRREHAPGLILDSFLLRSLSIAGWAPSFVDCAVTGAPGPHSAFVVQLGGVVADAVAPPGAPRLDARHPRPAGRTARRATGRRSRVPPTASAARRAVSSPRTRSSTSSAGCARFSMSIARPPGSPGPSSEPGAQNPPRCRRLQAHRLDGPVPARAASRRRARPCRDRHGWQRPLGQRQGPDPYRGAPRGRGVTAGCRRRRHPDRRQAPECLRLLDRELEAIARGGALSHGLQPGCAAPAPRPAERLGCAGALGGASPPAVGIRHQGAAVRRAAHRIEQRAHAHDVRQLRRPQRAHGCRCARWPRRWRRGG